MLTVALVGLAALHIAASAIGRDPFGAATRWTTLGAAAAFAVAGFLGGAVTVDGQPVVELVSLPVALTVLAGSAAAQWRRRREATTAPDVELMVWLAGLALAVVPSIIAPVEPLRVWLAVIVPLASALAAALVPLGRVRTLRLWSAVVLTAGSVLMGARTLVQATFDSAEAAVLVAGAGAILVAAALVFTMESRRTTDVAAERLSTAVAGAGAALLLAAVVVLSDGQLVRTTPDRDHRRGASQSAAPRCSLGALGGSRRRARGRRTRRRPFAIGARLSRVATTAGADVEPDLWASSALGIARGDRDHGASIHGTPRRSPATVVSVGFSLALVLFAAAEGCSFSAAPT